MDVHDGPNFIPVLKPRRRATVEPGRTGVAGRLKTIEWASCRPAPTRASPTPHAAWTYLAELLSPTFVREHLVGWQGQGAGRTRPATRIVRVQVLALQLWQDGFDAGLWLPRPPGIYRTTITAPDLFKLYSTASSSR